MKVKNYMISSPITCSKDDTISEALDLFKRNSFHRLPVVDSSNKLIGLITEGVIASNTPTSATSLSIYELNYLLSKSKVSDVMISDPISVDPEMLLEEAADLMRKKNIGCLPVTIDGLLVGIITKNDIFKAFVEILGHYSKGSRLVLDVVEDSPGILKQISTILAAANINISHMVVYRDRDIVNIVVRVSDTNGDQIADMLRENGFVVSDVKVNK